MVLSIVALAGPASAAKIKSCQKDKKINENIQKAFAPFFLAETSAERAANVQDGDKIAPLLEESTAAAQAAGQSSSSTATYPVSIEATCDGKKNATFTYDLALGLPKPVTNPPSSGAGLNFAGDAVLVKGKWVITGLTICDLIGANPNTPTIGQRCQDAVLG
jgi:hypothetical protein